MKRFRFKLDPLLRIRRHHEQQAERDLAAVNSELISVNDELSRLSGEVQLPVTEAAPAQKSDGRLDLSSLYARHAYLNRMQQEIEAGMRARSEVEERLSDVRERFQEAHRETEVLSRLREVRSARHYAEERRVEAVELDDVVGSRAVRNNVEKGVEHGS